MTHVDRCVVCGAPLSAPRIWTCARACESRLDAMLAEGAVPSAYPAPLSHALRARWRRSVHAELDRMLATVQRGAS